MREILFKAKRIDNGEWVEGDLLHPDKELGGGYYIEEINKSKKNNCHEVIEETVCQYTGLVDKNSNKIWENDILQVDKQYSKGVYKVKWADGAFEYTSLKDGYSFAFDDSYFHLNPDYCEVIGNIFDNPELMEATL